MDAVILFGASKLGTLALELIEKKYAILCFCDNDDQKKGSLLKGLPIIGPENLKNYSFSKIIITSSYAKEIAKQLIQMKIYNFQIFKFNYKLSLNLDTDKSYLSLGKFSKQLKSNEKIIDILESEKGVVGRSQFIFNSLERVSNLTELNRICEIGPGNGWFIDKLSALVDIKEIDYCIYEAALDWRIWLEEAYGVSSRDVINCELKLEKDNYFDLVHAHAVLVYLNYMDIISYLKEMIRVTRKGGLIFFNVLLVEEHGLKELNMWEEKQEKFPVFFSKNVIDELFRDECKLISSFRVEYGPTFSRYYIYKKDKSSAFNRIITSGNLLNEKVSNIKGRDVIDL